MNNNVMRSDLGKVQGLGSAKHGVGHWKIQRITAIGMIPLLLWFIPSLLITILGSYNEGILWIQNPFNATGLILLIAMVGAITLTFSKRENVKRQNYFKQIQREKSSSISLEEVESDKGVKIDD